MSKTKKSDLLYELFPRKFFCREEGAIAAWFAISIPIIIGFAALAVDMSYGFTMRNKAQITASSAALAGAAMLPDPDEARAEALDFAALNMPNQGLVLDQDDVLVGNWVPETRTFTDGLEPYNAVQVTTRLAEVNNNPISLYFASFFGRDEANVNTPAIAVNGGGEPQDACLIALEPIETGLYMNGQAKIHSDECGVCVNSSGDAALRVNGDPELFVGEEGAINVHGKVVEDPEHKQHFIPDPTVGAEPCLNPFEDVTAFDNRFANDDCTLPGGTYVLDGVTHFREGVHCGSFKSNGASKNVVFDPGVHHFMDASWTGNGPASIQGTGVTILLTRTRLKWNGNSDINLTAGSSGFVFFQNPDDPPGNVEHAIGGTNDAFIDGIQNFGMQDVKYHGTTQQAATAAECSVIVGRRFENKGTMDLRLAKNCTSDLPEVNASTLTLRLVD